MWDQLLSKNRLGEETKNDTQDVFRNSFHKDYDRIIFSNAFRRLSKKTQVHPLAKNDHVHNRLTHSLEVASVGRSLGLGAGIFLKKEKGVDIDPQDVAYVVQSACLAHDLGNPPFGHAGEEVIRDWFEKNMKKDFLNDLQPEEITDFQNLDGNAQSFRIVSQLENHMFSGGMRLTYATLGTLVKYPYSSATCQETGKSKFNYFQSEKEIFETVFENLGLTQISKGHYKRHPLSYLMEAADDICYGLLDLQDAIELEIIRMVDIEHIFDFLCPEELEALKQEELTEVNKISKLVARAIDKLTRHALEVFEKSYEQIVSEKQPADLIEIFKDDDLKKGIAGAKKYGREFVFNEKRKIELELGAYNIIQTLLGHFIRAVYKEHIGKKSYRDKRVLDLMGDDKPQSDQNLYHKYQRVVDYIVGMTDNYAKFIAHQLNGMSY